MKRFITFVLIALSLTAMPVFAAYTPSVEESHAPKVLPDADGDYGKAYDSQGNVIYQLTKQDVIIIPLKEAADTPNPLGKTMLDAYEEIESGLIPDLEEVIVRDVFGIQFSEDVKNKAPAYVRIILDVGDYAKENLPQLMFKAVGSEEWILLEKDAVQVNSDGTLQIQIPVQDGVLVLLEDAVETDADHSQGTGAWCCKCPRWCWFCKFLCIDGICLCWLILLIVFILLLLILRKVYKEMKGKEECDDREEDSL